MSTQTHLKSYNCKYVDDTHVDNMHTSVTICECIHIHSHCMQTCTYANIHVVHTYMHSVVGHVRLAHMHITSMPVHTYTQLENVLGEMHGIVGKFEC